MPFKMTNVAPALFMTHKGIEVFHVYPNDDADRPPNHWHYTLDQHSDESAFDIRRLDVPEKERLNEAEKLEGTKSYYVWMVVELPTVAKLVIASALDKGILKA